MAIGYPPRPAYDVDVRYLAALLAVGGLFALSGCASAHRVVTIKRVGSQHVGIMPLSQLPKITGCTEITFNRRTHQPKGRSIKCSGYHPIHKKHP